MRLGSAVFEWNRFKQIRRDGPSRFGGEGGRKSSDVFSVFAFRLSPLGSIKMGGKESLKFCGLFLFGFLGESCVTKATTTH